jgi:hypothetical protein
MAWIKSHEELAQHAKTKKAARTLGIGIPQMIGHLNLLWWWTMRYAPSGDLSFASEEDIADGAMWDGDAHVFVDALISCSVNNGAGFIEKTESGLFIHDWDQHGGTIIERQKAEAERYRNRKEQGKIKRPQSVRKTSAGTPQNVREVSAISPQSVRADVCVEIEKEKEIEKKKKDLGSSAEAEKNEAPIAQTIDTPEKDCDEDALIDALVTFWNKYAPDVGLAQIASFNRARRYALHAAFKDYERHGPRKFEFWEDVFRRVFESEYLRSLDNVKKWLTIDWVLKPENLAKILEGKFDNSPGSGFSDGPFDLSAVNFFKDEPPDDSPPYHAPLPPPEEPPPELLDFGDGEFEDFLTEEEVMEYAGTG